MFGFKRHESLTLLRDGSVLALSILLAIIISRLDVVRELFVVSETSVVLTALVAGLFFTSAFTAAPAIVVLGQLAQANSVFVVGLVGGVGAALGDLILFRFFKDTISADIRLLMRRSCGQACVRALRTRPARFLSVILGGFIIASPFPDELGLALMGVTRISLPVLIPVSYTLNATGIILLGLAARQLM